MSGISRRKVISLGAVGVSGVAAAMAHGKKANAQSESLSQPKVNPDGRFAGKVVLITGATSGIGEATARAFAAEGATVHFCGRRQELGQQVAQSIVDAGGKATYQPADVRNEGEIQAFVDGCVDRYSKIDVAFNNAGIESSPKTIAEQTFEDWENVMSTNARGVFFSMKYELPIMVNSGGGAIINNASVSGHVGFATISPYSASKHAVMSLTKVAALEYADKNIRVNSISPGAVDTPMLRRALSAWNTDFETVAQDYPIKRIIAPEEIARGVMWLASADPIAIVGTDLDATGGYLTK
ncbi:MAG: SDR family NAD(P)-dependent oxidoreductase [Cyanobacteria bacterium P01_A01_bin.83]